MAKKAVRVTRLVIILPLALLAAFFLSPKTSLACSGPTEPPNYTPPPLSDRINAAPYIFDATAGETPHNVSSETLIQLKVHQYFKGSGPATVNIKGFGQGTDCHEQIPAYEAIYFTWGDSKTNLQIGTFWEFAGLPRPVFGYRFTEPFSNGLVAEIVKATGRQPVLPEGVTVAPTPTLAVTPTSTAPMATSTLSRAGPTTGAGITHTAPLIAVAPHQPDNSLNWLGPVGAGLLVVVLGISGFFLLRNQRSP